jgi:hypothetical protein
MTKEQHETLCKYVRDMQVTMRLADWQIIVEMKPTEDGTAATIDIMDTRKVAVMCVAEDFFEDPPEKQRHTIVHELLHVHLWLMYCAAGDCEEAMTKSGYQQFLRGLDRGLEIAVDGIADFAAVFMPLIPECRA